MARQQIVELRAEARIAKRMRRDRDAAFAKTVCDTEKNVCVPIDGPLGCNEAPESSNDTVVLSFDVEFLNAEWHVAVVWLATEPVDPRDLLSGNYVALRYGIALTYCERGADEDSSLPVWVQLVPNGDEVVAKPRKGAGKRVPEGPVPGSGLYRPLSLSEPTYRPAD